MEKNYIIYHRDNRTLDLTNHFDPDGDLDPNYLRLRNIALTGEIVNGKFVSKYPEKFKWLIECAKTRSRNKHDHRRCTLCNGIFKDVMSGDYTITNFYMEKVVKPQMIQEKARRKKIEEKKEKINKFDKYIVKNKETKLDPDRHPLYDQIVAKFVTNKEK